MEYENLSPEEIQGRIDKLILSKKPEELNETQLQRRIELAKQNKPEFTVRGTVKGISESLPAAGAMFGGAAGFLSPIPGGAMAGAGAGGLLGEATKQLINKYALGEEPTRESYYKNLIGSAGAGAAGEGLGGLISKGIGTVGKMFKEKPNAQAIREATESVTGQKATGGQLIEDPVASRLESSLEQSPTIAGYVARQRKKPVYEGAQETVKGLLTTSSEKVPSQVGSEVKSGLRSTLESRLKPSKEVFEDLRGSTEFIDVSPRSKDIVSRNIEGLSQLRSSPATPIVKSIAEDVRNIRTADDIKTLRTSVGRQFSSAIPGSEEKAALGQVYAKLSKMEESSILRSALAGAKTKKEGAAIAKKIVEDFKGARSIYKGVMSDVKETAQGAKLGKPRNVEDFMTRIEAIPDEQLADKFFKADNRKFLEFMEKTYPKEFTALKENRINQIYAKSLDGENLNVAKFIKQAKALEPKTQDLLFGKGASERIKALETFQNSLPKMAGPSGTPQGLELLSSFNFINPAAIAREFGRGIQYGLLQSEVPRKLTSPQMQQMVRPTIQTGSGLLRSAE